ncbi:MAG: dockerin type I domain-containing protein [Clostridia bacterium]|nr:dockerin type I domain-containing protein [Clostridia bacterium]
MSISIKLKKVIALILVCALFMGVAPIFEVRTSEAETDTGDGSAATVETVEEPVDEAAVETSTETAADETDESKQAYTTPSISETMGNLVPPVHNKYVTDNLDGTYDIILDVEGLQSYDTNVVLVLDLSSSIQRNMMQNLEGVDVTSLTVLQAVATNFINEFYDNAVKIGADTENIRFSIVVFTGSADILQTWTNLRSDLLTQVSSGITSYMSRISAQGNTNSQAGLYLARMLLENKVIINGVTQDINYPNNMADARNFVVFMTDGAPNRNYIKTENGVTVIDDNPTITTRTSGGTTYVTTSLSNNDITPSIQSQDYIKSSAEALLNQAQLLYELDQSANFRSLTTLTVGLNEWFTPDLNASSFPTASKLMRLVAGVANGLFSLDAAKEQLGDDVPRGSMPGTTPAYPILLSNTEPDWTYWNSLTVGSDEYNTYLDSYIATRYKVTNASTGAITYSFNSSSYTPQSFWLYVIGAFGTFEEQANQGVYRLGYARDVNGNHYQDENGNWVESEFTPEQFISLTNEYVYFGDTQATFQDSFDAIATYITMGYGNMSIVDMLSQNVSAMALLDDEHIYNMVHVTDEIAAASVQEYITDYGINTGFDTEEKLLAAFYGADPDLARAIMNGEDGIKNTEDDWNIFIIRDPSFISVEFTRLNETTGEWEVYEEPKVVNGVTQWESTYVIVTNQWYEENGVLHVNPDVMPELNDGFVTFEFKGSNLMNHNTKVSISITVTPTQYAIDTLYENRVFNSTANTKQFIAYNEHGDDLFALYESASVDGTQSGTVTYADTNGYPDQSFTITYDANEYGMTHYSAPYYPAYLYADDSLVYSETPEYGFFTNTFSHSRVRYVLNEARFDEHAAWGGTLAAHYDMPVIQPDLVNLPVTKEWPEGVTPPESVYIKLEWTQHTYDPIVLNDTKRLEQDVFFTLTERSMVVELNATNGWTNMFTNLPQGHTYTITEWADADCTVALDSYAATFALANDVTATKVSIAGSELTIANPCLTTELGGGLIVRNAAPVEETITKVIDFGSAVTYSADDLFTNAQQVMNISLRNGVGEYGDLTFDSTEKSATYNLKRIMNGIDTFVFDLTDNATQTIIKTLNIVPASSVYYEDDFNINAVTEDPSVKIIYSDGWTNSGDSSSLVQGTENENYGYDAMYAGTLGDSGGSSHHSTTALSTATFTFKGTGIEIYSRTNTSTGQVIAQLFAGDSTNTTSMTILHVDTLYRSGELFNVPTIKFDGLAYNTYTVRLMVLNLDGRCNYYLDGFRVYNPLGSDSQMDINAYTAYNEAHELSRVLVPLRKVLLSSGVEQLSPGSYAGAVFIDKIEEDTPDLDQLISLSGEYASNYETYGPKNEVYLSAGQGIGFTLNTSTYERVIVDLRAPANGNGAATVTNGDGATSTITLNSTVSMGYIIVPDSNGNVVITNSGTSLIAITNIRVTGLAPATRSIYVHTNYTNGVEEIEQNLFVVNQSTVDYLASFNELPQVEYKPSGIVEAEAIFVNSAEVNSLVVGQSMQYTAVVYPENAYYNEPSWSIRCETGEATINANGVVTATKPGVVYVVATAKDGSGVCGEYYLLIREGFTVKFNANGDTLYERTVKYGETLTDIPNLPTLDRYIVSWNFDNSQPVYSDMVVEATFTYIFSRGDVSEDYDVTAADASVILRYIVGLMPVDSRTIANCADLDGDGEVTAADAAKILRYLVRLEDSL